MTITPSYARRRLTALQTLLDGLRTDVPRAIDSILAERDIIDGYPTGISDITVRTSRGTTTVEQAIVTIDLLDTELDDIAQNIDALASVINDILDLTRKRAPRLTQAELDELRCSGGAGRPGAIEWGRPICTNIKSANRNGMCDACYMREYRWLHREKVAM